MASALSVTWAHPVSNNPHRQQAFVAKSDRLKLEKATLALAHRVKDLETEVRGRIDLQADTIADAERRIAELQWEAEAFHARDENIQGRLDQLKAAIMEKRKCVSKEIMRIAPDKRPARKGAQFFRLIRTDEQVKRAHAKEEEKLSDVEQLAKSRKWQEEVRKRHEERNTKEVRLRERAEELRRKMRATVGSDVSGLSTAREKCGTGSSVCAPTGSSTVAPSSLVPSSVMVPSMVNFASRSPRTPRITREAWLQAYAEDSNAELERRIVEKEQELQKLEEGILKNKKLLEERARLAEKRSAEIGMDGRPTHRLDRKARNKKYIAGTKECEYLQQALGCIPPLEEGSECPS